ncbi:trypsin 5G1-like [Copidosoma floridanum]|uniref:trypsin 5G1-like n=1 Tax=Copidosoma floridanum TaxID=29053 RepID=UPI0006C9C65A|nr:trypsin 5G1-like [Copidosoma floridanum]
MSVRANIRRRRMIGGNNTTIKKHPYQVAIEFKFGGNFCSGVIISIQHVLTAAHCLNFTKDFLQIRSGSSLRDEGGTLHDVVQIKLHELFRLDDKYENSYFDIGLASVNPPFSYDDTRRPIALNKLILPSSYETDRKLVVTGWGVVDHKNTSAHQLQALEVPWHSKEWCNKTYEKFGGLHEGQICTGYVGVRDMEACPGDSGDPLVIDDVLVGIVIYGEGDCGRLDYPTVYTEVAYFIEWITHSYYSMFHRKRSHRRVYLPK